MRVICNYANQCPYKCYHAYSHDRDESCELDKCFKVAIEVECVRVEEQEEQEGK